MMLNAKNKLKNLRKSTGYLRAHCGRAVAVNVEQALKVAQNVAARFAKKQEDSSPIFFDKFPRSEKSALNRKNGFLMWKN